MKTIQESRRERKKWQKALKEHTCMRCGKIAKTRYWVDDDMVCEECYIKEIYENEGKH